MRSDCYVWLIWVSAFLVPWVILFAAFFYNAITSRGLQPIHPSGA